MKLVKNMFLSFSYQLLLVIIPLITTPYLSRVLGPNAIGENSFTAAITQYFILFAVLGTNLYGNREIAYHKKNKKQRSIIFWEINFLRWITSSISIIFFLMFILLSNSYREIFLLQGITLVASMFDVSWYFMGRENFKVTVGRNFIIKILTVFSIFLFVHSPKDLTIYIFILSFGTLLGNLSIWPYLKKEVYFPDIKQLKISGHLPNILILFIPVVATQVCIVLNRIILGILDSVESVGYFSQSSQVINVASSVVVSIGIVMLPRVSNMKAENNFDGVQVLLYKTFNIVTGIAVPISFGLLGISLSFAPFFFGGNYDIVGPIMMIQAPTIIFMAWSNVFGTQFLLPFNRMKTYTVSVVIEAIISLVLNLVLIPIWGIMGAAFSITISEVVLFVLQAYFVRKDFSIKNLFNEVWKYLFSGIVMFSIIFFMNVHFEMSVFQILIQILIGIVVYVSMNIVLNTTLWSMSFKIIKKILF